MSEIIFSIRIFLFLILLPSALGKLVNRTEFDQAVQKYEVLPAKVARVYSALLPWIELALGLALLLGVLLRVVALGVLFLLISFSVAVVINIKRRRTMSCHCYGLLDTGTIGWGTVARNMVLIVLNIALIYLAPDPFATGVRLSNWQDEILLLSSIDGVLPLGLLLIAGFLILRLIEEGLQLRYWISQ